MVLRSSAVQRSTFNHWEGEKHESGASRYTSSGITLTQEVVVSPTIHADSRFIEHGGIVLKRIIVDCNVTRVDLRSERLLADNCR